MYLPVASDGLPETCPHRLRHRPTPPANSPRIGATTTPSGAEATLRHLWGWRLRRHPRRSSAYQRAEVCPASRTVRLAYGVGGDVFSPWHDAPTHNMINSSSLPRVS